MVKSGEGLFIGRFVTKISGKGRVAVPVKLRNGLGDQAIISQGYQRALFLVSKPQWEKLTESLRSQPLTASPVVRDIERFLFGSAYEVEFDDQGRIVVPQELRQFAGLNDRAVFVGLGNRIEIWAKENWEKYEQGLRKNIEDIAGKLDGRIEVK